MTLGDLIKALEKADPERVVPFGFSGPHSYRGIYADLAFEPAFDVTIAHMLQAARSALGKTFTGYKGGEFLMDEDTDCWIAEYGHTGEYIGDLLLAYMLHDPAVAVALAKERLTH